jgi:peroxiredoxin
MRIKYLLWLPILLAGFACQRNHVKIEGRVEGGQDMSLSLERLDVNRTTVIDSANAGPGGVFSFRVKLEGPELFILKNSSGEILNLLLYPGDRVMVSTSAASFGKEYRVEGSEESENIRILVEQLNRTRKVLDSLFHAAETIEDPQSPRMKLLRTAYTEAIVSQKRFTIRYLVEHMNDLSSVYALYQKYDEESLVLGMESDFQYFRVVADSLEVSHPNSSLTRSLRTDIQQREAAFAQASHISKLLEEAEETGFIDVSIPDREGREIPLSSLKGKVVLVVFWASGNEASISTLLQLKSTYDRYRPKGFEVYAISLDNNKLSWMNAMDFNEFNWVNVSDLSYPDSKVSRLYNVTSLPSSYLINREGEMMAKNLYGKRLETWLDNLL